MSARRAARSCGFRVDLRSHEGGSPCVHACCQGGVARRDGPSPAVFEQTLRLARHVRLFEVIDHACELLAARFGDVSENARLGDASEIAVDGRSPACGHRIKTHGAREDVAMGKTALDVAQDSAVRETLAAAKSRSTEAGAATSVAAAADEDEQHEADATAGEPSAPTGESAGAGKRPAEDAAAEVGGTEPPPPSKAPRPAEP